MGNYMSAPELQRGRWGWESQFVSDLQLVVLEATGRGQVLLQENVE